MDLLGASFYRKLNIDLVCFVRDPMRGVLQTAVLSRSQAVQLVTTMWMIVRRHAIIGVLDWSCLESALHEGQP